MCARNTRHLCPERDLFRSRMSLLFLLPVYLSIQVQVRVLLPMPLDLHEDGEQEEKGFTLYSLHDSTGGTGRKRFLRLQQIRVFECNPAERQRLTG